MLDQLMAWSGALARLRQRRPGRPMSQICRHLDRVDVDAEPGSPGYEGCLKIDARWVHLPMFVTSGRLRCCDSSPNKHATVHRRRGGDRFVQPCEPGEGWVGWYEDELAFVLESVLTGSHR